MFARAEPHPETFTFEFTSTITGNDIRVQCPKAMLKLGKWNLRVSSLDSVVVRVARPTGTTHELSGRSAVTGTNTWVPWSQVDGGIVSPEIVDIVEFTLELSATESGTEKASGAPVIVITKGGRPDDFGGPPTPPSDLPTPPSEPSNEQPALRNDEPAPRIDPQLQKERQV